MPWKRQMEIVSRAQVYVVIPAYNEGTVLSRVVTEVKRAGYAVVVVDDGSTDASAAVARQFVPPAHYVRRENGGPARIIIPKLYAWKGAKFVRSIEFLEKDKLGFWEVRGYSNTADPWTEDRFS